MANRMRMRLAKNNKASGGKGKRIGRYFDGVPVPLLCKHHQYGLDA